MIPPPIKSNLQHSFWLTGCPLFHFKIKNFINLDQIWQHGRVGEGRNAAEVITWFRLSWFWFKRGRVCQKISRRSPVSVPRQNFFFLLCFKEKQRRDRDTKWKERHAEQRGIETVKHTPRQWNKVSWHKEAEIALREMNALRRETGENRGGRGKVLPENTFLIAQRSDVAKAQTEINTWHPQFWSSYFFSPPPPPFPSRLIHNHLANMTVYLTLREQGPDNMTEWDREANG